MTFDSSDGRLSHATLHLVVEEVASAIVLVDADSIILHVNRATETLFGYSRDGLVGQSVDVLVPDASRAVHPGHRADFFRNPRSRAMGAGRDLFARRRDGTEFPIQIELVPIQAAADRLLVLAMIVDMTERKRFEAALEKERAFLRQVIDVDPNFIFAKDRQGRFTLVNQAVADAYGTTVNDMIGKTDADYNANREQLEFFRRIDLEVIETRSERFIPEEQITDATGRVRYLQTVKRPLMDQQGVTDQVLGSSTDITHRRQAELELRQQREELAHVARVSTIGELASTLAHELNQPLTAVLSNAQVAKRYLNSDADRLDVVREIVSDIIEQTQRAAEIVSQVRSLVKRERRELGPLDLAATIKEVVLLAHGDAVRNGVKVSLDIDAGLPRVRGEKVQLQQVMLNLLLNAFDSLGRCAPRDRRVSVHATHDPLVATVSVIDRGTGLTSDSLTRIFEPFYTTKHNGLGLGLSISRSIIEMHGGRLWAEHNPAGGAVFHFTVPVVERAVS
jgi:PAS domain S-box-containing protein